MKRKKLKNNFNETLKIKNNFTETHSCFVLCCSFNNSVCTYAPTYTFTYIYLYIYMYIRS
jgi:hypothetical protein